MANANQEDPRYQIIRNMFVDLQSPNSPHEDSSENLNSRSTTPELTVEYIPLKNNDDAVTEPETLENYINQLRHESEANKKDRGDDDTSTVELNESDDNNTDISFYRTLEEVRHRTPSYNYSPIQRVSETLPILIKSIKDRPLTDEIGISTPNHQSPRRSSRIKKRMEQRTATLSITPRSSSSGRRQKRVSKARRSRARSRTIGTQTTDYWFNLFMGIPIEYDIIPRRQRT